MKNRIGIIIVNYNGRDLLEECMPTILDAAVFSDLIYEIIIIDNTSTDDSLYFLRKKYPAVMVLSMMVNNYWFSVNDGIKKSSCEYLLLLNNDIKLDKYCIKHLMGHFDKSDETLFAVSPREVGWDGVSPAKGAQSIEMRNENIFPSTINYYFNEPHITFKADNSLYAKDKLVRLGLFDPIFSPFYCEDVDVSYRAWKAGFKIIYEPKAVIYHKSGATINKFISQDIQMRYKFKNSLLFIWKNITDRGIFLKHILFLLARLAKTLLFFKSKKDILIGFALAMVSLRRVTISRREAIKNFILTDRELFHKLSAENFYGKD